MICAMQHLQAIVEVPHLVSMATVQKEKVVSRTIPDQKVAMAPTPEPRVPHFSKGSVDALQEPSVHAPEEVVDQLLKQRGYRVFQN